MLMLAHLLWSAVSCTSGTLWEHHFLEWHILCRCGCPRAFGSCLVLVRFGESLPLKNSFYHVSQGSFWQSCHLAICRCLSQFSHHWDRTPVACFQGGEVYFSSYFSRLAPAQAGMADSPEWKKAAHISLEGRNQEWRVTPSVPNPNS